MKNYLCYIVFFVCISSTLFAQPNGGSLKNKTQATIYEINIQSEINTTSRIYLLNGLKEADAMQADAVLIHLNTYGGSLVDADSMRTAILYNPIPVYAFIDNNAASAGALISIACKKIFMRTGASIGAATVVEGAGGEQAPDKYQSYMRSMIRATAESHGRDTIVNGRDTIYKWIRDPNIAEAMVDNRIYIPNVIDSGRTLTLTSQEALRLGFCDGIVDTEHEIITKYLKYDEYSIVEYKSTFYDNLKGFLTNPAFQAFLIMLIIAGIYFELQSPGIGFPTIVAISAAVLYFTPLYIDGLAQNWELVVFIIGILLILIEIFVIPGFGLTGISGIVLIAASLIFALLDNDLFSFREVEVPDISRSILTVLSGMLLGVALILWLSSRIGQKGMFRKIALTTDLESSESVDIEDFKLVGQKGKTLTALRPSGKIMIQGEVYDAISNRNFIEEGNEIKVVKFENMQLYVEKE
ncbi:MAG: nodulation protein NfeD [Candidatus Azobacteroides sp.]|nr:nodulation protein NfeD [Candidatus Azobacteroides sp.]